MATAQQIAEGILQQSIRPEDTTSQERAKVYYQSGGKVTYNPFTKEWKKTSKPPGTQQPAPSKPAMTAMVGEGLTKTDISDETIEETIEKAIEKGTTEKMKKGAAEQLEIIEEWETEYPKVAKEQKTIITSMEESLKDIKTSETGAAWIITSGEGKETEMSRKEAIEFVSKELSEVKRQYGIQETQYGKIMEFKEKHAEELKTGVEKPEEIFIKYRAGGADWFGIKIPAKHRQFSERFIALQKHYAKTREQTVEELAESPQLKAGLALTIHDPLYLTSGITAMTSFWGEKLLKGKSVKEAYKTATYNVYGIRKSYAERAVMAAETGKQREFIIGEMGTGAAFGGMLAIPGLAGVPGIVGTGAKVVGSSIWAYQISETIQRPTAVNIAYSSLPAGLYVIGKGFNLVRTKAFSRTVEIRPVSETTTTRYGVFEISGMQKRLIGTKMAGFQEDITPYLSKAQLLAEERSIVLYQTQKLFEMVKKPPAFKTGTHIYSFRQKLPKAISIGLEAEYKFKTRFRVIKNLPEVPEYTRMLVEGKHIVWEAAIPSIYARKYILIESFKPLPKEPAFLQFLKPADIKKTPLKFGKIDLAAEAALGKKGRSLIEVGSGRQKQLLKTKKKITGKRQWQVIGYETIQEQHVRWGAFEETIEAPTSYGFRLAGIKLETEPMTVTLGGSEIKQGQFKTTIIRSKIGTRLKEELKTRTAQKFRIELKKTQKTKIKARTKERFTTRIKTTQKQIQKQKLLPRHKTKYIQRQKTRLSTRTGTKFGTSLAPKRTTITVPKITIPSVKKVGKKARKPGKRLSRKEKKKKRFMLDLIPRSDILSMTQTEARYFKKAHHPYPTPKIKSWFRKKFYTEPFVLRFPTAEMLKGKKKYHR